MLCARATLTAGPRHKRYKAGTVVEAVVFARAASHPDDLEGEALKPLAARGWQRITITGHKQVAEDYQFSAEEAPEAQAFRAALDTGFGVLVIGLVQ